MNEALLISLCGTVAALLSSTVKNPKSRKKLTKPLTLVRDAINVFLAEDEPTE
jgi:hypothetical protein